jgi:hypothetical protein
MYPGHKILPAGVKGFSAVECGLVTDESCEEKTNAIARIDRLFGEGEVYRSCVHSRSCRHE